MEAQKFTAENPLTIEHLRAMEPRTLFAQGTCPAKDLPEFDGTDPERLMRWVAVRGGVADWAIYALPADRDADWIYHYGDKLHEAKTIQALVPCNEAALLFYRR